MQSAQGLARRYGIANLLVQHEAHRRIDGVLLAFAASAENYASSSSTFALDGGNISGLRTHDIHLLLCLWQQLGIVHDSCVATLKRHHLPKFFQCFARAYEFL